MSITGTKEYRLPLGKREEPPYYPGPWWIEAHSTQYRSISNYPAEVEIEDPLWSFSVDWNGVGDLYCQFRMNTDEMGENDEIYYTTTYNPITGIFTVSNIWLYPGGDIPKWEWIWSFDMSNIPCLAIRTHGFCDEDTPTTLDFNNGPEFNDNIQGEQDPAGVWWYWKFLAIPGHIPAHLLIDPPGMSIFPRLLRAN